MNDFDPNAPVTEQASFWWVLLSEGEPTVADSHAFAEWVARSPERVAAFLQAAQLTSALRSSAIRWPKTSADELLSAALNARPEIAKLPSASRGGDRKHPGLRAAVAAAGLIIVGIGIFLYTGPQRFETAIGEQRSVVLTDGSLVTLNTSSSIEVHMESDRRTVQLLSGEALFDVAHDVARPFDVVAGGTTVRAVGTQFDVDRRPGVTTVTVVEGKVLISGTGENRLPLAAGEQVTLGAHATRKPVAADTTTAVAWTQRKLIFAHRQLADVAAEFNRYNRQSIEIRSAELRSQEISGVFQANDPGSFLTFLARLPDVHIEKSPDNLHFIVTLESRGAGS
ncbi:MAG TPA: FecR domain-containing protein [Steroidobacteraceae bacterium]